MFYVTKINTNRRGAWATCGWTCRAWKRFVAFQINTRIWTLVKIRWCVSTAAAPAHNIEWCRLRLACLKLVGSCTLLLVLAYWAISFLISCLIALSSSCIFPKLFFIVSVKFRIKSLNEPYLNISFPGHFDFLQFGWRSCRTGAWTSLAPFMFGHSFLWLMLFHLILRQI